MLAVIIAAAFLARGASAEVARNADRPEQASDKQDRMICKRFVETGSLVKGYRTCKTKREWERERDAIRAPAAFSGSCNSAQTGQCNPGLN